MSDLSSVLTLLGCLWSFGVFWAPKAIAVDGLFGVAGAAGFAGYLRDVTLFCTCNRFKIAGNNTKFLLCGKKKSNLAPRTKESSK